MTEVDYNEVSAWQKFRNQEKGALAAIYQQHVDDLFRYGHRFTNDEELILDCIQELFYDLIRYRARLSPTNNVQFYLMRSLRRILYKSIRKQNEDFEFSLATGSVSSDEDKVIEDEEAIRRQQLLNVAMQKLKPRQREALYYKYIQGYSYDEITEIMNISNDSARKLVSRGIAEMKEQLSSYELYSLLVFSDLIFF